MALINLSFIDKQWKGESKGRSEDKHRVNLRQKDSEGEEGDKRGLEITAKLHMAEDV